MTHNPIPRPAYAGLVCVLLLMPANMTMAADNAASQPPVFGLRVYEIPKRKPNIDGRILLRAIYRQGLLMAAREGFVCRTRDQVLGEDPGKSPLVLQMGLPAYKRIELSLVRNSNDPDPLWQTVAEVRGPAKTKYLPHVLMAEEMSRGIFRDACAAAGLHERAPPAGGRGKFPLWLAQYADRMNLTCSFLALRKLHEIMRRDGESPELLARIATGYAELGTLTTYFWSGMPKAFWARGLLYAARGRALFPEAQEPRFALAYALAMTGLPAEALAELGRARQAAPEPDSWPVWARLIEPFCRYDLKTLAGFRDDRRAQYLRFLDAEFTMSDESLIPLGEKILKRMPDCYRIHAVLAAIGGVSNRHGSTLAGAGAMRGFMRSRLLKAGVLPKTLPVLLKAPARGGSAEARNRMAIIDALVAGGRDDVKEMSWACLGRMLHEVSYQFIRQRMEFMKYAWNVDADDYLEEQKPLWQPHPYAAALLCRMKKFQAGQGNSWGKSCVATYKGVRVHDVGIGMQLLIMDGHNVPRLRNLRALAEWHTDTIHYDLARFIHIRGRRARYLLRDYLRVDPYNSHAAICTLKYNPRLAEPHVAEWEERYAGNAVFLMALAHYYRSRSPGRAVDYYRKVIDLAPQTCAAYWGLARIYRKRGDRKAWRETLEKYLKQPDIGLQHAAIRRYIADDFIKYGDYKQALPYAEKAAETWAEWAMHTAGRANEMVGNLKRADLWMRRASERYDNNCEYWFIFCYRTERPTLKAARAFMQKFLPAVEGGSDDKGKTFNGYVVSLAEKNYMVTRQYAQRSLKWYPRDTMWRYRLTYALLGLGDKEGAVRVLRECVKQGVKQDPRYTAGYFGRLAKVMVNWLQAPDAVVPDDAVKPISTGKGWKRMHGFFTAGYVLSFLGKKADALKMYQRTLRVIPLYSDIHYAIAWREVKAAGVDPYTLLREQAEQERRKLAARKKQSPPVSGNKPVAKPKPETDDIF